MAKKEQKRVTMKTRKGGRVDITATKSSGKAKPAEPAKQEGVTNAANS